jgi:HlyD family secretion protein
MARRQRWLLGTACVSALLSTAGLGASLFIKSPQQVAAEAAGPPASVLTAAAERRVLRQTVVLRGQVAGAYTVEVTPTPRDGAKAIVTAVRTKAGSPVTAGSVIVEVSGRPLVALPGSVPAYRDLRPGSRGNDVAQLQRALKSLGHNPGETGGFFGAGTKRALSSFYEKIGFPVTNTGETDQQAVEAARRQVVQAERALADARAQLTRVRQNGGSQQELATASTTVQRATKDLNDARQALASLNERTGPMLPLAEVVFLPTFPARVEKTTAQVGAAVKEPLMTLSSGALVVNAYLNPAQHALVKPGMKVEIVSEMMGITAAGRVSKIGELTQDQQRGSYGYPVTVGAATALDAKLAGQDVRLTVEAASTNGEVLAVPLSAISVGADGRTVVLRRLSDGREERVEVKAGTTGDGYVAVTPVSGDLQPGDRVVIGWESGGGSGAGS